MSAFPQTPRTRGFRSLRTITALIMREIASSKGRVAGGFLWIIVEPVAGIVLLSLVFSLAFHAPPIGTSFPLFYVSGMVPFLLFNSVCNKISASVRYSRPLLDFPAVTFVDAIVARFLLNMVTEIIVFTLLLSAIIWWFDLNLILDPLMIVKGLLLLGFFALGLGTLNCFLFTAFPAYELIWSIVTRPLFVVSGVLFIYDNVPGTFGQILWFNPIVHGIGTVRQGIYATYNGNYISDLYVMGVSLVLLMAGLLLMRRHLRAAMEK